MNEDRCVNVEICKTSIVKDFSVSHWFFSTMRITNLDNCYSDVRTLFGKILHLFPLNGIEI